MRKTQAKLPPDKIIQTYIDAGGKPNKTTFKALDDACGDATAELWLMGASTLASLWQSAWIEGHGNNAVDGDIVEISQEKLMGLYQDPKFLPSCYLSDIDPEL